MTVQREIVPLEQLLEREPLILMDTGAQAQKGDHIRRGEALRKGRVPDEAGSELARNVHDGRTAPGGIEEAGRSTCRSAGQGDGSGQKAGHQGKADG